MNIVKNLLVALMCFSSVLAFAKDEITLISGDKISAKVLEITMESILYQHPDSMEGIPKTLLKKDVFMIRYANGTKEVFQENLSSARPGGTMSAASPDQMYALGQRDAEMYYKGNDAFWGSAACAVTVYGLVGSVIIGAVKPAVKPDRVSDMSLIGDPDYYQGYQKRAHQRKKGKAALGAGMGLVAVPVVAVVVLLASWQ